MCLSCSTPPGAQANYERWSLVFFTRPGNSVLLEPLAQQSPMIAAAVAEAPRNKFNTGSTSLQWFSRRIKNQRVANRTVRHVAWYICPKQRFRRVRRLIALAEALSGSLMWFKWNKTCSGQSVQLHVIRCINYSFREEEVVPFQPTVLGVWCVMLVNTSNQCWRHRRHRNFSPSDGI
jgi:hypothetical protein